MSAVNPKPPRGEPTTAEVAFGILADAQPTFPRRNAFLEPADPDMGWADQIVREAEDAAVQSRRRPLYREGLLTPECRPVVRCAECDLEREPDERDCPQCGSERALQEAGR